MVDPGNAEAAQGDVIRFFSLAFAFSWLLWLPDLLKTWGMPGGGPASHGLHGAIQILGGLGPTFAAVWLTGRRRGWAGIQALIRRTIQVRLGLWTLLPTLLLIPLAVLAAHLANHALTGAPIPRRPILSEPWMILVLFAVFWVMQYSEEPGWRGFALERLQARWGPLAASLLLGFLWAAWHLPMFLSAGFPQHDHRMPFAAFTITLMLVSVLITWLQNKARGSLVPAMALHAWVNTSGEVMPLMDRASGHAGAWWAANGVLLLIVVAVVAMGGPRPWIRRSSPGDGAP